MILPANAFGVDVAVQIDLQRGIDGEIVVEPRKDGLVVRVARLP